MNRLLLTLFIAALALCASGCDQAGRADTPAGASPTTRPAAPKSADKLLLLDDDEPEAGDELRADNSRCLVCHLNFEREELSLNHARAGVGCVKCHGESDAHIADESWASGGNGTAPDIMYPRDKINPGCLKCHQDKLDPVIHKSFLAGKTEQKQCTECHGKHKMVNRKCVWK